MPEAIFIIAFRQVKKSDNQKNGEFIKNNNIVINSPLSLTISIFSSTLLNLPYPYSLF